MMYKIMQGLVDISVPPSLLRRSSYTSRGHNNKLHIPHTRTNIYKESFFPATAKLWNSLPESAVTAPSLPAFRQSLKGWTKQ